MEEEETYRWQVVASTGHGAFTFVGDELRLASTVAIATRIIDGDDILTYAPVWLLLAVEGVEEGRYWLELGLEVFWTEREALAAKAKG